MPTFARHIPLEDRILIARAKRQLRPGVDMGVPVFASKLPGDTDALRGIPVIGRGVSGARRDTRPGSEAA